MQVKKLFVVSLFTLALVPGTASAQTWFITPFVGTNFGGGVNSDEFEGIDDANFEFVERIDFGATAGWNPGWVGFEVDLGWSPKFFADTPGLGFFESGDSHLFTLMGNVLFSAPPVMSVRPYGSTGFGLIRTSIGSTDDLLGELTENKWGFDIGGGVNGNFSDNVGVRGDIRYFRSLEDTQLSEEFDIDEFDIGLGKFHYWRATVGVMFRW